MNYSREEIMMAGLRGGGSGDEKKWVELECNLMQNQ